VVTLITEGILDTECLPITTLINCVGVMGRGLAEKIAKAYPGIIPGYRGSFANQGFYRPWLFVPC